ncbi:MAG: HAD hydrolase family protein [Planctomycetota bacterium]
MPGGDPKAVRLLVLDVDGCLTDGSIMYDADGRETKRFSVRDGLGIAAWRRLGLPVAIITGRESAMVTRRAGELGITRVYQGVRDKAAALAEVLSDLAIEPEQAAAFGDDWNDLPMLAAVGFAACPADAADEVKQIADYVCGKPGGHGAVREVIDHLLRASGRLEAALASYRLPAAGGTSPAGSGQ